MISPIKALVSRVQGTQDARALASNFGYLMLLQVAGYMFPLITIPYLARVIGVEGFGKIAFAAAVVMWFQTVADWGFNYTATRDVARNRDDPEAISEIFSNVLWSRIVLMLLSFVLLLCAIAAVPYFKENQNLLLITFLLIPGHILFPDWFFQAMEKMKYIAVFDLLSKAFFTVLVFVFIKEKADFILQPFFVSLGYAVSGLFAMYVVVIKWRVKIIAPQPAALYSTIKGSTNVFINNIMPNLYNSLAVVLLGFFGGATANGIYDAGRKFVSLGQSFMVIIIRVTFPFFSRKLDKHAFFAKVYLTVSIAGSLILFVAAPVLIKVFFTEAFNEAVIVLRISAFSIFFVAMSQVYGTNYLILKNHERALRNIIFTCSILGFVISLPLVYYFSYIGATLTLVFTQAVLGFSVLLKARSVRRLPSDEPVL